MDPFFHVLVPVLAVLALRPDLDRRMVVMLSPLTLVADLDWFFSAHRYLFHNVFFVVVVAGIVYAASQKNHTVGLLALFFLASHLVLDLTAVGLFYPLYPRLIGIDADVYTNSVTNQASLGISYVDVPLDYFKRPDVQSHVFSTETLSVL